MSIFFAEETQALQLAPGSNSVNFYVLPEPADLEDMLAPLQANLIGVIDEDWSLQPNPLDGHLISEAATLPITGEFVPSNMIYNLSSGG